MVVQVVRWVLIGGGGGIIPHPIRHGVARSNAQLGRGAALILRGTGAHPVHMSLSRFHGLLEGLTLGAALISDRTTFDGMLLPDLGCNGAADMGGWFR